MAGFLVEMKYYFWLLAIVLISLFFAPTMLFAAVRCEIQYGREVCVRTGQLQIDKEVLNPQEKKFVDNLGINDHKFAPGEEITFKLRIKNVGDATFGKVRVQDTLPQLVELSSGQLTFELPDVTAGKTEEREIKVRVVGADKFPVDKNVICVVNAGEAQVDSERDRDTAQFCLEKKVLAKAPPILPPTGPKDSLVILLSSLLVLTTGMYLLMKTKQKVEGR